MRTIYAVAGKLYRIVRPVRDRHYLWSDEAQQAMVCTCLIAEVKAGRISTWERETNG